MYTLKDVEKAYSYYGKVPFFYNTFSRLSFFGKPLREKAIGLLGLKKGDKVLDIGCGTGLNFRIMEDMVGRDGSIVGVDYSKEMLHGAERLIRRKRWGNIKLIKGDAARIRLKQRFDAVISVLGFSAVPDHRSALKNSLRVLKKGKKMVMLEGRLFRARHMNIIMPLLRWGRSWDKDKDLAGDIRKLFPGKKIKVEKYNLGSNLILELTK
ncbi:methyltransferase domain-containing protein [Candidatus Woesearchaeota archaeon]|nr:methyltransferase domain-containing protein [Candidatus Woesearchaeota archaeon]